MVATADHRLVSPLHNAWTLFLEVDRLRTADHKGDVCNFVRSRLNSRRVLYRPVPARLRKFDVGELPDCVVTQTTNLGTRYRRLRS
jgi:hypothetical protein